MFSRASGKALTNVKTTLTTSSRKMAIIHNFKPPTMDELPVPKGSWSAAYGIRQKQNNAMLIGGLTVFSVTLFVFLKSGIIKDFGCGPEIGVNEE